jgi:hypothetical protein
MDEQNHTSDSATVPVRKAALAFIFVTVVLDMLAAGGAASRRASALAWRSAPA